MASMLRIFDDIDNPLNRVEEIFLDKDWVYTRDHNDKISVHVSGEQTSYVLTFFWQAEFSAIQFVCEYDLIIPDEQQTLLNQTLRSLNTRLWLGHFDVIHDGDVPCFRHTTLMKSLADESLTEYIYDLLDIALAECERHFFAFNMLAHNQVINNDTLELALCEQAGQA